MKENSDIYFEKRKNLAKSHYENVKRSKKELTRMFLFIYLLIVLVMIVLFLIIFYFQSKWFVPPMAIIGIASIMYVSLIIELYQMEKTDKNGYMKFENKTIKL